MKHFTLKMILSVAIFGFGLNSMIIAQTAPKVDSVAKVVGITDSTAFSGCFMVYDASVTEKGLCWSTSGNPTLADSSVNTYKVGSPAYEPAYMEGLLPNTTYHVRAYAVNSTDTGYSAETMITTSAYNAESVWPLSSVSTINPYVSGDITASVLDTSGFNGGSAGFDKNGGGTPSYGDDYMKIQVGIGDTVANFNPGAYLSLSVAPKSGNTYTVNAINFVAFGYKTGSMKLALVYSLDNFVSDSNDLGPAIVDDSVKTQYDATMASPISCLSGNQSVSTSMGRQYITFSPNIEIPDGKTMTVRLYAWGKHDITLLIKDIVIAGDAKAAGSVPVVDSVAPIIGITNTTAFTGGFVISNGGDTLTERGVCYGTSENPTIADNKVPSFKISTSNDFEPAYLEGLQSNTTYYVRAYATNANGTSYSPQKSFTTTNNAEVLWQLEDSTQFGPAVTGEITSDSIDHSNFGDISGWDKDGGKPLQYDADYLKIQAGVADADFHSENYLGFSVAPKTGYSYTVKKLNLVAFGYKTTSLKLAFEYSLDGFTTSDSLGTVTVGDSTLTQYNATQYDPITCISGSPNAGDFTQKLGGENISISSNIVVPDGKTLTIRMYGWGKNGVTVLMKDVIVSGNAQAVSTPVPQYTVTVAAQPSAGGSVTGGPSGPVDSLSVVNLTATANTGYDFDKWVVDNGTSVDSSETSTKLSYTVISNVSVTAKFKAKPTSIETTNAEFVKVYPSPAVRDIMVQSASVISEINVVSLTGQIVTSVRPNAQTFDLNISDIPQGFYLVVVNTSTGKFVKKVQIIK